MRPVDYHTSGVISSAFSTPEGPNYDWFMRERFGPHNTKTRCQNVEALLRTSDIKPIDKSTKPDFVSPSLVISKLSIIRQPLRSHPWWLWPFLSSIKVPPVLYYSEDGSLLRVFSFSFFALLFLSNFKEFSGSFFELFPFYCPFLYPFRDCSDCCAAVIATVPANFHSLRQAC